MDQSKKGFLPMLQGVKLRKTQNSSTGEYIERMKVIPYASVISSTKYDMMCTRPVVCLAMSLARGYNSDPRVDHWTTDKIILRYLNRTKEMFLYYGGAKEIVVKSYVNASFDTDPYDSKSRSGYILKVGEII